MKTNIVRFAALGIVALAVNLHAATGPYLSMDVGLALVDDITSSGVKLETDPGVRFGLAPGYTFVSEPHFNFSGQVESGIIYNSLDKITVSGVGSASVDGDFIQVPVLGDLIFTFEPNANWALYAGGGGGVVYGRIHVDDTNSTDDEWDAAGQVMAGIQYKIDGQQQIGFGYKFLVTFPDDIDNVTTHSFSLIYTFQF